MPCLQVQLTAGVQAGSLGPVSAVTPCCALRLLQHLQVVSLC